MTTATTDNTTQMTVREVWNQIAQHGFTVSEMTETSVQMYLEDQAFDHPATLRWHPQPVVTEDQKLCVGVFTIDNHDYEVYAQDGTDPSGAVATLTADTPTDPEEGESDGDDDDDSDEDESDEDEESDEE